MPFAPPSASARNSLNQLVSQPAELHAFRLNSYAALGSISDLVTGNKYAIESTETENGKTVNQLEINEKCVK